MTFCGKCGNEIPEGQSSCPKCGFEMVQKTTGTSSEADGIDRRKEIEEANLHLKQLNEESAKNREEYEKRSAELLAMKKAEEKRLSELKYDDPENLKKQIEEKDVKIKRLESERKNLNNDLRIVRNDRDKKHKIAIALGVICVALAIALCIVGVSLMDAKTTKYYELNDNVPNGTYQYDLVEITDGTSTKHTLVLTFSSGVVTSAKLDGSSTTWTDLTSSIKEMSMALEDGGNWKSNNDSKTISATKVLIKGKLGTADIEVCDIYGENGYLLYEKTTVKNSSKVVTDEMTLYGWTK